MKIAEYNLVSDVVIEPLYWVFGPLHIVSGLLTGNLRNACRWPPVDLVVRLCGGQGSNHRSVVGREFSYGDPAPGYWRRVAHWWGWVVPGYCVYTTHGRWTDVGNVVADKDIRHAFFWLPLEIFFAMLGG